MCVCRCSSELPDRDMRCTARKNYSGNDTLSPQICDRRRREIANDVPRWRTLVCMRLKTNVNPKRHSPIITQPFRGMRLDLQQSKDVRETHASHSTVGEWQESAAHSTGTEELVLGWCLCPTAMHDSGEAYESCDRLMNPQMRSEDDSCVTPRDWLRDNLSADQIVGSCESVSHEQTIKVCDC